MHLHVEVEKNLGKDEEEDQGWNGINNKIKLKKRCVIKTNQDNDVTKWIGVV